ncbi:helix-turn-helix transcriptional regulator [bacterium]|nr:helix-turn-helix transcriptional regulator [bacterium]
MDKDKEYRVYFGKSLRELRIKTGKSLRMFAYEYDIPCATLSRIENGTRNAQLTILKKISEGFGMSFGNFISAIEKNMPIITLKDE